ncbi:Fe3+-citrate ABC transporter substrate-binding protein [Vibrio owensii]|uniref:Fe3+-citrate ABC transporter substrate-binding protein n=1 Tax=Vibrio owensii TaxID=696485 RepID=UPI003394B20B
MSKLSVTNTGERFISVTKYGQAIRVAIPKPCGERVYRSIGTKNLGLDKALKEAIKVRNKLGRELWGEFWSLLRDDKTLLYRLPRSLEPSLQAKNYGNDPDFVGDYYVANWIELIDEKPVKKNRSWKIGKKHGKIDAYIKAKRHLQLVHRDVLPLLKFMGRIKVNELL